MQQFSTLLPRDDDPAVELLSELDEDELVTPSAPVVPRHFGRVKIAAAVVLLAGCGFAGARTMGKPATAAHAQAESAIGRFGLPPPPNLGDAMNNIKAKLTGQQAPRPYYGQPMGQPAGQPMGQPMGQPPAFQQQPPAFQQQPQQQPPAFQQQPQQQAPAPGPAPLPPPAGPPPTTCADKESCLQIVDAFLDNQPRAFGLLQVRGEKPLGGGSCGGDCNLPGPCPEGPAKCRYDTYDSALAAIYYVKRGKYDKAKEILDAFNTILYPVDPAGFHPPKPETQYVGSASGKTLTLLASSYNMAVPPQAGNYEDPAVTDGGVDAGNNAWAALAFAHYAAAQNSPCHAVVARDILGAMVNAGDCSADTRRGYMGHFEPYTGLYRSAEHNIDLFGLSKVLGDQAVQQSAGDFVSSLFNANRGFPNTYATGTTDGKRCDATVAPGFPIAVDATFWNILADADPQVDRLVSAMTFATQTPQVGQNGHPGAQGLWVTDIDRVYEGGTNPQLSGFRFSTQGNGVHWENTAGAVMAMVHFANKYGVQAFPSINTYIEQARDSMKQLLTMYGAIPSSVVGGNYVAWEKFSAGKPTDPNFPGGTDTGMGWPYLRYTATAPTAWAGLMLLQQADMQQPVDESANPYAPPPQPVPPPSNDQTCLPQGAMAAR